MDAIPIFNQFTYTMLMVSVSILFVYGLVRACIYVPEQWTWIAAGTAEVLTVGPGCAAIYQITGNFELSMLMFVFFAVGAVPALAPRFYKYRQQMVEANQEKRHAEGVLDDVRKQEK